MKKTNGRETQSPVFYLTLILKVIKGFNLLKEINKDIKNILKKEKFRKQIKNKIMKQIKNNNQV